MTIAHASWTRRLTIITALVIGFAGASAVDANADRGDRRDRREDRRELRQERRQDRRQLRREDRRERRREYRQERRRHRIHRVAVPAGVAPHCAVVPGFTGSPMISLERIDSTGAPRSASMSRTSGSRRGTPSARRAGASITTHTAPSPSRPSQLIACTCTIAGTRRPLCSPSDRRPRRARSSAPPAAAGSRLLRSSLRTRSGPVASGAFGLFSGG